MKRLTRSVAAICIVLTVLSGCLGEVAVDSVAVLAERLGRKERRERREREAQFRASEPERYRAMKTRQVTGGLLVAGGVTTLGVGGMLGIVNAWRGIAGLPAYDNEMKTLLISGLAACLVGGLVYADVDDYIDREPARARFFIGPAGAGLAYRF